MKPASRTWSARYLAALRFHLRQHSEASRKRARRLGRAAAADRLTPRDLAIAHERALVALKTTHNFGGADDRALERAGQFLLAALTPFERPSGIERVMARTARRRSTQLGEMSVRLRHGNRRLREEIVRRKAAEHAVGTGREEYRSLFLESQAMQKELRHLARQVLIVQEEERKQISRELHDGVVQTLLGINVELSALGTGAAIGLRRLKARISHTRRLVEKSVRAVHRFARELRPAVLDDLGLIPALHAYSQSLAERKKLKIEMTAFGGVESLGVAKRTALFRVAQEALTNVARHAAATRVYLSISKIPGAIRMVIDDNGKAFDMNKVAQTRNPKRLGLLGMRERIEMVGGRLSIDSAVHKGTTVCAEIPFKSEQ